METFTHPRDLAGSHCSRNVERMKLQFCTFIVSALIGAHCAFAGVGDPQIRTDHPWYPGELACSTFERLFATQAQQYERATGIVPKSDQDRALASWFWSNTHYSHAEEAHDD